MARALLLNASFEPLCVVSSRRAVVLVLKEKAEIVHRNGAEFRSERRNVPVPDGHPARALRARARSAPPRRCRAGRCSPATAIAASTAAAPAENLDHVLPAFARRAAHVGERRRVVPVVQRPQGGPAAARVRDGAAPATGRAARDHVADRVGRPDRSRVEQVPRPGRGRLRLTARG